MLSPFSVCNQQCFTRSVCWISLCEGPPVYNPNTPAGCEGWKHGARHAAVPTQAGTWWTCTCEYHPPRNPLAFSSPRPWCWSNFSSFGQLRALGTVPMCSTQMERMFNTTRIPGIETGRQAHTAKWQNEHILADRQSFFKFGKEASPPQLLKVVGHNPLRSQTRAGFFTSTKVNVSTVGWAALSGFWYVGERWLPAGLFLISVTWSNLGDSMKSLPFPHFVPCFFRCGAALDWPKAPHRVPQRPFLPSVAVHWRAPPLTQWTRAAVPKDPQWHVRAPTGRTQTSCLDCREQARQPRSTITTYPQIEKDLSL